MPATSPAQALGLILHAPANTSNPDLAPANQDIVILDYRDPVTFSDLWLNDLESPKASVDETQKVQRRIDLSDSFKQYLIIGNDPPDGVFDTEIPALTGINFRSHFTATSWLAAWKVKFSPTQQEKDKKKAFEANTRIAVIDPRESRYAQGAARALQSILGARDVSGHSLVPGATVLNAPGLANICEWLHDSKRDTRTVAKDTPDLRDLLKSTIWNELTSNREQHHALSNVLGAFLLSIQVGRGEMHPGDPWTQDYLLALVQALGIDATLDQVRLKSHGGLQRWITPEQQKSIEGVVLIDDMADLWGYFLRGATGFAGEGVFERNPARTYRECLEVFGKDVFIKEMVALPGRLGAFFESRRSHLLAGDILGAESKLRENFVLFLDLRLFPTTEQGKLGEAEADFFKQLRDFGKILLGSKRNLPWTDAVERNALENELDHWADQATRGQDRNLAPRETLLPRLIALLDPTLPIVVFSSTHRTELIEPFRGYGNIVTDFHKPVVSGLVGDWPRMVREMHAAFLATIERASRTMRARRACQRLRGRTLPQNEVVQVRTISLPAGEHGYLMEVFLDESEDPIQWNPPRAVCAGGVVVIRSLDRDGRSLVSDWEIFESLKDDSRLWGWCSETPDRFTIPTNAPQRRGFMPKGADLNFVGNGHGAVLLERIIGSVQDALGNDGTIFPIAAVCNRESRFPDWMEIPQGVSPWAMEKISDATLRRLMQHLIEGLIFRSDLLRTALQHKRSSLAIDLGIRDYPCQPNLTLHESFGFEVRNGWRPSFNSEDGFLLTGETMARIGIAWPYPSRVVRARAVPLRDFGNNPGSPRGILPKQLHYFADTVAHVALHDLDAATSGSEEVRKFFKSGWIADFRDDDEEPERIEIGRAWDQGDRVPALRWAAKLAKKSPPNGIGIDIFRELSEGLTQLRGQELQRLFSEIA